MIIVIDFETTGLVKPTSDWAAQPGIVQIGAQKIERSISDGKFVKTDTFNRLVNPEMAIPDETVKIHGITSERVAKEPTFFGVFPEFAEFCRGSVIWTGYNTRYDRDVLFYQLQRYGFERNFPWPPGEVDVMKLATDNLSVQGKQGAKRMKLVDAYKTVFGKDYTGAHDAMADVSATADLFIHWEKP